MQIEIQPPLVIVKYSSNDGEHFTFEVWHVPSQEEAEQMANETGVASQLMTTFEGSYDKAHKECVDHLEIEYTGEPQLWIEKGTEIAAIAEAA